MGLINKQWDAAMSEMGREFSQAEQDAGWPVSMRPIQLAGLQRPWRVDDAQAKHFCIRLLRRIEQDCKSGDLLNESTTKRTTVNAARMVDTHKKSELFGATARVVYTVPAVHKDITIIAVAAPAFGAWLTKQGETPSPHVQAWFDAVGVAGTGQTDARVAVPTATPATVTTKTTKHRDLLTPLVEEAQKACDDSNDTAAVFTKLKTWAQDSKPRAPLVGVTEDGLIQWRDSNDTPKELDRKALAKRLKRQQKTTTTTQPGTQLRRIK